ncbi:MAG: hypothetical protein L6R42_006846 [Xanthoria sp. 1 TBL-2021]|nr:MAG: hypothetical protein L6R42_006846 [Xanthoria sp. 1 TBL-2021]
MYRWYEESKICYVYLADFFLEPIQHERGTKFRDSRWFHRGWTLQELLAPYNVVFYDARWMEIGSKYFLHTYLTNICRISTRHLSSPKEASVAAKMSWASRRETTRKEDMAYSLLGLFGVKMPLIYGEGENAFFRLQCEIIQSSSDESIFAWMECDVLSPFGYSGLLAASPRDFENSGDIVSIRVNNFDRPPYSMTNQGLSIELIPLDLGCNREGGDNFAHDLRENRDPRLKERNTIDGRGFKSVFAYARDSTKEASAILTLRMIDGKLASRVFCSEIGFEKSYTDRVTSSEKNAGQTFFVGQQRYAPCSQLVTDFTHVTLTAAFRERFVLDELASRSFSIGEDASIIARRGSVGPGSVGLHFTCSQGYSFTISWDEDDLLNRWFFKRRSPTGYSVKCWGFSDSDDEPILQDLRSHYIPVGSDIHLELRDNLIEPIDDKLLLSISTREAGTHDGAVVLLDVASIGRLKALE